MADPVGQFVVGIENLNAGRPGAVIPMQGEEFRRSVYVQVRRTRPLSVLSTFDAPAMEPNCEVRASSTVAPQSLMLMNNDFIVEQAGHFAGRVRREAGSDVAAQATLAWQLALGVAPSSETVDELKRFLAEQAAHFKTQPAEAGAAADPELVALSTLAQAIWSSNEFLYVD
jgi:hypothetical protein